MKSLCTSIVATIAFAFTAAGPAIGADPFPSKPIKIIVNTAPGGFTDIVARVAAQYMAEYLKQPVVVDNRAGGDGMIAIRNVKTSPADGYTLLAATGTAAQQMALRLDPGYDLLKDFAGIGIISRSPFLMAVGSTQPDKTFAEFIARVRAHPGMISYASAGVGTVPHFAIERLAQQMNLRMSHIPYKGNAPAIPDVIGGRVPMMYDTYGSSGQQVKSGQFRVLGVTSSTRLAVLPDVPTIAEQGVPGYSAYTWVALYAPTGTPPEVMNKLYEAFKYAKSNPVVLERFKADGMEPVDMTPPEFMQFLAKEVDQNQKIVKDLGLEKQ